MLKIIRTEPALVVGAVVALIGVLSAFGLGITQGQSAAIVALVGSVLALAGAGVTRSQVYSPATVAKIRAGRAGHYTAKHVTRVDQEGRIDGNLVAAIVVAGVILWLIITLLELLTSH